MDNDARPRDSTSLTAVLTMSFRRPVGTTAAPASASPSAIALPMPEVAPITTATRFVRSNAFMDMSGTILFVRRDGGQHNAAETGGRVPAGVRLRMDLVTFGEAMVRLTPPEFRRLEQATSFDVFVGGGELNVAVAAARLGISSRWVSRLPPNALGRMIANRPPEAGGG